MTAALGRWTRRMPLAKLENARAMRNAPTEAEAAMWALIRRKSLGVRFRRQAPLFGYIADFWCPELALVVEVDGGYHADREALDERRDGHLRRHGVTVCRYTNEAVLNDPAMVLGCLETVIASLRLKLRGAAA